MEWDLQYASIKTFSFFALKKNTLLILHSAHHHALSPLRRPRRRHSHYKHQILFITHFLTINISSKDIHYLLSLWLLLAVTLATHSNENTWFFWTRVSVNIRIFQLCYVQLWCHDICTKSILFRLDALTIKWSVVTKNRRSRVEIM